MRMSLKALFTDLGIEVTSRSEDAFELDKLSTVIPSQEFTVLLLPHHAHLKILREKKEEKRYLRTSSRGIYSNH